MEDRAESKLNSMRLTTHVRISDKSARSQHNIAVLNKVQMDIYISREMSQLQKPQLHTTIIICLCLPDAIFVCCVSLLFSLNAIVKHYFSITLE